MRIVEIAVLAKSIEEASARMNNVKHVVGAIDGCRKCSKNEHGT